MLKVLRVASSLLSTQRVSVAVCAVFDAVVVRPLHSSYSAALTPFALMLLCSLLLAVLNVLRVASSALTVASPHAVPLRAGGALPCPPAGGGWGVGVGTVVTQGLRLGGPWGVPLPRGLFSVEGVGVFFGGHKNNPQALILEGGWGGGSFHAYEQYTPCRW